MLNWPGWKVRRWLYCLALSPICKVLDEIKGVIFRFWIGWNISLLKQTLFRFLRSSHYCKNISEILKDFSFKKSTPLSAEFLRLLLGRRIRFPGVIPYWDSRVGWIGKVSRACIKLLIYVYIKMDLFNLFLIYMIGVNGISSGEARVSSGSLWNRPARKRTDEQMESQACPAWRGGCKGPWQSEPRHQLPPPPRYQEPSRHRWSGQTGEEMSPGGTSHPDNRRRSAYQSALSRWGSSRQWSERECTQRGSTYPACSCG